MKNRHPATLETERWTSKADAKEVLCYLTREFQAQIVYRWGYQPHSIVLLFMVSILSAPVLPCQDSCWFPSEALQAILRVQHSALVSLLNPGRGLAFRSSALAPPSASPSFFFDAASLEWTRIPSLVLFLSKAMNHCSFFFLFFFLLGLPHFLWSIIYAGSRPEGSCPFPLAQLHVCLSFSGWHHCRTGCLAQWLRQPLMPGLPFSSTLPDSGVGFTFVPHL